MTDQSPKTIAGPPLSEAPGSVSPEAAMRKFHAMHAKCGSLSDPFDEPDDDKDQARRDNPNV